MFIATSWCLVALVAATGAERWRWPEGAQSVRIDTKVRFVDSGAGAGAGDGNDKNNRDRDVQSDDPPFEPPSDTEGFYNRPPGAGRYPVRVEPHPAPYRVDGFSMYPVTNIKGNRQYFDSDGTLDSLQYCKCVSTPDCNPRPESTQACGSGMFLCCYKRPNKVTQQSEVFNELEDERPMLYPGIVNSGGVFSNPGEGSYGHFGPNRPEVLVGPGGPTGYIRPPHTASLLSPEFPDDRIGPNGNIGPKDTIHQQQNKGVLVGPDGPTGVIGLGPVNRNPRPDAGSSESAQRGVLVGPGGPTGFIGPHGQRPVLTGPGGPTGMIGPLRGGRRGVLSGPGGPTGIIGPGYGRQNGPGILVGPGGPTGIIGPGRQLLVGPGGPTGLIGPRYFESASAGPKLKSPCKRNNRNLQSAAPVVQEDLYHGALHSNLTEQNDTLRPPQSRRAPKRLWLPTPGIYYQKSGAHEATIKNNTTDGPRFKRAPRRRIVVPKRGFRRSGEEPTTEAIITTTRKKITDKERIPIFMFFLQMMSFVLRIFT